MSKGRTAANQIGEPIPEEWDQITDAETQRKMIQWKVVIGNGLSEELAWPKDAQYQLVFPEHYCLRWHSSAGPKRQACVYGHPQDCSEEFLYKHPHEFIPHVLWLLSDSQDHKECPCQPCHVATGRKWPQSLTAKFESKAAALATPAADTKPKKATAATAKSAAARKKSAAAPSASQTPTPEVTHKVLKEPAASKTAKKSAMPKTTASTPASAAAPATATAPAPAPTPTASVQPAATPAAPHPTVNNEPTLFRRGEMVWFQQGPAWRIGVIRQVGAGQVPGYVLTPLAHSVLNLADVPKQQHEMRPFLTFSVPAISIPELQNKTFPQISWEALLKMNAQRPEFIGLEASKMAALEIDGSWSTFNPLTPGPKQPQNKKMYGGVFLGAEMIRLGDAIRHREKSHGIMEVTEITVTAASPVPNPADPANTMPAATYTLSFRGIEYEASLVAEKAALGPQPQGAIFVKDSAFRTAAAKATGAKQKCVWTISSWDTVWAERDVGGRLYVTNELIGVTQGAQAAETALATGVFSEATAYLNNRMQNAASKDFGRKANRRTTVGAAVAPGLPLSFGEGVTEEEGSE